MWGGGSSSEGDPFRVLGLEAEPDKLAITDEAVKARYITLAKALHPDMNGGSDESKRRFQAVAQAYSKLATQDKRRQLFESRGSFGDAATWSADRRGAGRGDSAGTREERYDFFRRNKFRDVSGDFNTTSRASTKGGTQLHSFDIPFRWAKLFSCLIDRCFRRRQWTDGWSASRGLCTHAS